MDDPFSVTSARVKGQVKPNGPRSFLWESAWNVSDSGFALWRGLVEDPQVDAVLAGHFHDNRRSYYDPPYAWSESSERRANPEKTLIAPPLSGKYRKPARARGYAVIKLYKDSVIRRLYWFDTLSRTFVPEGGTTKAGGRH